MFEGINTDPPLSPDACQECGHVPPQFPGHINVQEIITNLQETAAQQTIELDRYFNAMEVKNIDDKTYETLFSQYYKTLGELAESRRIAIWIQENTV